MLGAVFRNDWLKKAQHSRNGSEKILLRRLRRNADTEYGKRYGFSSVTSVASYQDQVPLSTYDDYEPYISETIKTGRQKLIVHDKISFFATTSGTVGFTKLIPHIAVSYFPYFKWLCITSNDIVKAMKKRHVPSFNARGILLTEIFQEEIPDRYKDGPIAHDISLGGVSSFAVGGIRLFLPLVTQMPGITINNPEVKDLTYIKARYALQDPDLTYFCGVFSSVLYDFVNYLTDNRELLIRDIELGRIDPSVQISDNVRARLEKKLKPDPIRAAELRAIFETESDTPLINRLWKNMSYVFSIGSGDFEPFTKKLKALCCDDVSFGYVLYSASEAFMGCAMNMDEPYYLLVNDDAFFEFLPVDEPCDRPLRMHELKEGKLYEVILTNISGFYRYQIKDVIRVVRFEGESPYVQFAYRANRIGNLNGTHITGEHFDAVVRKLEEVTGKNLIEYSAYVNFETEKPRIELFAESEDHFTPEEQQQLSVIAEEAFQEYITDYALVRKHNTAAMAQVYLLKPGTYAEYRRQRVAEGASLNQLKTPRVLTTEKQYNYFKNSIL